MGLGLRFAQGEGPRFAKNVRDEAAVAQLVVPDMGKLRRVFDALTSIPKALHGQDPLIGFRAAPGPWLATWSWARVRTTTAMSKA